MTARESVLTELLATISLRGNISALLDRGIVGSQLSALLQRLEEEQLIAVGESRVEITDLGRQYLLENSAPQFGRVKDQWITGAEDYKIKPVEIFAPWLPKNPTNK